MFTELLLSSGHLFWLCYSTLRTSYHSVLVQSFPRLKRWRLQSRMTGIACCNYVCSRHSCPLLKAILLFQIQMLMQFVRTVYQELPNHMSKIFEPRPTLRVKDLSEINIEALLTETYTIMTIQSEKKTADGTVISVCVMSLCIFTQPAVVNRFSVSLRWIRVHCVLSAHTF